MPLRVHPTSAASINVSELSRLLRAVGARTAHDLMDRFVPSEDGRIWTLDDPFADRSVTLTQAGTQVAFRVPGAPLRHLPLTMELARLWAAAWIVRLAIDSGRCPFPTVDEDLSSTASLAVV